jgi:hypothetical protein
MRDQINDKLKSLTDLAVLVSTRIYRGEAPANIARPYVTWRVDDNSFDTHPINAPRTADRAFISISIFADDGPAAEAVSDTISKDTSAGGLDHDISTLTGKDFTFLIDDPGSDADELLATGSEQSLFVITQTWTIWHSPAT